MVFIAQIDTLEGLKLLIEETKMLAVALITLLISQESKAMQGSHIEPPRGCIPVTLLDRRNNKRSVRQQTLLPALRLDIPFLLTDKEIDVVVDFGKDSIVFTKECTKENEKKLWGRVYLYDAIEDVDLKQVKHLIEQDGVDPH